MDERVPEHRNSHASSSYEPSLEPTPVRSEDLGKHSVYTTHFPKDRNCEICQRTKITMTPCRRPIGRVVLRAENFGDLITADHKVLSGNCDSRNNHGYAIVMQDLATQWIQSYPCKTKTSQETQRSLQACEDLSWNHNTSTPQDGRNKTSGGDQDLRTSTLIRDHPIRGESQRDFIGESEGSLPLHQDSIPDAGEAINDFWSISGNVIYRHHVEPRVKLFSPREKALHIPLKYIDVSRTTHTTLDVTQESRIDDYWNIDGSRDLSDSWTGFTQFTL